MIKSGNDEYKPPHLCRFVDKPSPSSTSEQTSPSYQCDSSLFKNTGEIGQYLVSERCAKNEFVTPPPPPPPPASSPTVPRPSDEVPDAPCQTLDDWNNTSLRRRGTPRLVLRWDWIQRHPARCSMTFPLSPRPHSTKSYIAKCWLQQVYRPSVANCSLYSQRTCLSIGATGARWQRLLRLDDCRTRRAGRV